MPDVGFSPALAEAVMTSSQYFESLEHLHYSQVVCGEINPTMLLLLHCMFPISCYLQLHFSNNPVQGLNVADGGNESQKT